MKILINLFKKNNKNVEKISKLKFHKPKNKNTINTKNIKSKSKKNNGGKIANKYTKADIKEVSYLKCKLFSI